MPKVFVYLYRPFRGLARSHRVTTGLKDVGHLWERVYPRRAARRPRPQGSSPIPRKITLVTVCTELSKAMSDNASPPLSKATW